VALAANVKMMRPHLEELLQDSSNLAEHYNIAYKGIAQAKKQKIAPVKATLNTSDILEY
jgi:hypothetical protein